MLSFISYLLSGISLGAVYAIIALGYTMVYGIAKMLNFAHGDILMVGGYAAFLAFNQAGLPIPVATLIAVIVCTLLGVLIERVAYKPLRTANSLSVLITAIGVSYFLENLAQLIFSANPKSFTTFVPFEPLKLAGGQLTISATTIVTIIVCFIIVGVLVTFINKTKAGQAMLAVSEDRRRNIDGCQCKWYNFSYLCYWLCTCRHRRNSSLFGLSYTDADNRRYARYQSLRSSRSWRDWIDSGCVHRWHHPRYPRKSF